MAENQLSEKWKNYYKILPSVFTSTNLLLGVVSLIFTIDGNYFFSAVMILLSMMLDGMDGRVARRLNASSDFGKELDSLADLVSFGVAPALLIYSLNLGKFGIAGLLAALLFVLCGALRLARFNVSGISGYYVGLPITAAGGFMALMVFLNSYLFSWIYLVLMVILSVLMLSRIKVSKY